jgi:hypothetical protein
VLVGSIHDLDIPVPLILAFQVPFCEALPPHTLAARGEAMERKIVKAIYEIVEHDGGWAYSK